MNKKDLISVIVPVYNVELYLKNSVNSVLKQSYKNLQIILVDDGSKDNSGDICDELAKKDKRIQVIHKKNQGLSQARNTGLEYIKGDYILFLDSDDFLYPNAIKKLYNEIKKSNVDIVISGYKAINENKKELWKMYVKKPIIVKGDKKYSFLYEKDAWLIPVWGKLFKRKIFNNINFKPGYNYEDVFIYPLYTELAKSIKVIPFYSVGYLVRQTSITKKKYSFNNLQELEAHLYFIDFFKKHHYVDALNEEVTKSINYFFPNHYCRIKEEKFKDKKILNKFNILLNKLKNI